MNIRKPHPNLTIRSSTSVNFSAAQWGLKTDEFPRIVIEKVASYLNNRITREYNHGESEETTRIVCKGLMNEMTLYGANEKKAHDLLEKILKNLYINQNVKEPK